MEPVEAGLVQHRVRTAIEQPVERWVEHEQRGERRRQQPSRPEERGAKAPAHAGRQPVPKERRERANSEEVEV